MMRFRNGKPALYRPVGVLLLVLCALTGCVDVEFVDTTPAASTPVPVGHPSLGSEHDVAVLAVDFDPPLDYETLIAHRDPIALLVAVENIGSTMERNLTVRAQLSSSEDPKLRLTKDASVASIAPGEIQVVRFAGLKDIPYHLSYRLEVAVDPLAGESSLENNRKGFQIQIRTQQ